jgi:MFS transporter, DHA3 family, macrolide efflux protein
MREQAAPMHNMRAFTTIWVGQFVSIVGTGLTSFALGVWVYQRTGSPTLFAFIALSAALPAVLLSPFAGALVDRWDRRLVMMASDAGAALCTLIVAALIWTQSLEIWHIYLLNGLASVFNAFQQPAYQVAASTLVPKEKYANASGMMQAADGSQFIISPILAGVLMQVIGIGGVILIDLFTFVVAFGTLLLIRIPRPAVTGEALAGKGSLWHEIVYAWGHLRRRPGLFGILLVVALGNLMVGFLIVLAGPMMLALFESPAIYGTTMSVAGSGMLIGSVVLSVTGGPRQLTRGLFGAMFIGGLGIFLMGLRPNVYLITAACFTFFLAMPFAQGCFETLFRRKIVLDMQGRVFAFSRTFVMITTMFAYFAGGPLAEYLFEPLMAANGILAGSVGQILGVGPGRGIGLLLVIAGLTILLLITIGYSHPRIRQVEEELPDVVAGELSPHLAPGLT